METTLHVSFINQGNEEITKVDWKIQNKKFNVKF